VFAGDDAVSDRAYRQLHARRSSIANNSYMSASRSLTLTKVVFRAASRAIASALTLLHWESAGQSNPQVDKIESSSYTALVSILITKGAAMVICSFELNAKPMSKFICEQVAYDVRDPKDGWFALYAADGRIDDKTFCDGVERGNFRLHPKGSMGISQGCIVIDNELLFDQLAMKLRGSDQILVPGVDVKGYGIVTVS
jgi:hypothetical protein